MSRKGTATATYRQRMKKTEKTREKNAKAIVIAHLILNGQRINFGRDKDLKRRTSIALETMMERL